MSDFHQFSNQEIARMADCVGLEHVVLHALGRGCIADPELAAKVEQVRKIMGEIEKALQQ